MTDGGSIRLDLQWPCAVSEGHAGVASDDREAMFCGVVERSVVDEQLNQLEEQRQACRARLADLPAAGGGEISN